MSNIYQPPDDPNELLYLCRCEFDPAYDDDGEGSWHFKRTCLHCGTTWAGLHCPHDGYQNPCPGCGRRPDTLPTYLTAGQINAVIAAARALVNGGIIAETVARDSFEVDNARLRKLAAAVNALDTITD